jgi:hypothetical protein
MPNKNNAAIAQIDSHIKMLEDMGKTKDDAEYQAALKHKDNLLNKKEDEPEDNRETPEKLPTPNVGVKVNEYLNKPSMKAWKK